MSRTPGRGRGRAWLVRLVVSAGLLVLVVVVLDAGELLARLSAMRPGWVALAVAISVAQVALLAWRWRFTAGRLGIDLPFGEALREYYLGIFVNQVVPGGVVGDVSRAWRHVRARAEVRGGGGAPTGAPAPPGAIVRAVILERASAQLIMTGMAAASLLALPIRPEASRVGGWLPWLVASAVVVVAAGAVGVLFVRRRSLTERSFNDEAPASDTPTHPSTGVRPATDPSAAGSRSQPAAASAPAPATGSPSRPATAGAPAPASPTRVLWRDVHTALLARGALALQIASGVAVVASYIATYVVAARAVGVATPTRVLVPLVAPVLATMLIPATIAGWGLREGAAAVLWGAVGLTPTDGVVISAAYGLLVLLSSLPGALVLLSEAPGRRGRRPPGGSAGSADEAPDRGSRSDRG